MLKSRTLCVTGTDTEVGKTVVVEGLILALRARGIDAVGMKPVATGARLVGRRLVSDDAERLRRASDNCEPMELVCPQIFRAPLAPTAAARAEGRKVSLKAIERAWEELRRRHCSIVVEGIGVLLVPLIGRRTFAELAAAMGGELLVVSRNALGTINQTALTVEAARARGLRVRGVVLNEPTRPRRSDRSRATNAREIERLTRAPVLCQIPYVPRPEYRVRRIAGAPKLMALFSG